MSRHLLRYLFVAAPEGVPDNDLLRRYAATRDEAAFELLVRRHADLVWKVCRGVLRHDADAEDAFQATFLALARRADAIRTPCAAGWLQRVAVHAALKQKAKSARFRLADVSEQVAALAVHDPELVAVVHEELANLPEAFRLPLLLCDLEGYTHAEAAKQLGWPIGTVSGRLSRARDRLRERLTRRGVAPVIVVGSLVASSGAIRAAVAIGIGTLPAPSGVTALTTEVLSTMQTMKRSLTAVSVALMIAVAGSGTLVAVGQADSPAPVSNVSAPEQAKPAAPEKPRIAGPKERAQSQRNLRAIAQAIQAYHLDKGHLPTDILDPKTKKPLLSWRVAILPYIEQRNVYKLMKLDEPWDSENNKRLGMVGIKLLSAGVTDEGAGEMRLTYVKRFTGPSTLHQPGRAIDLMELPRSRQTTILLAEVGDPVPWTKPDDPKIDPALADVTKPDFNFFTSKEPAQWKGPYSNVVNVAFADGRAQSLNPSFPADKPINWLIFWRDKGGVDLRDFVAFPPEARDEEDVTALLKVAREMANQLVKLAEEEAKLRGELAKLRDQAADRSTPLADRLIELDSRLRELAGEVDRLRKEGEKAKKK